MNNVKFDIISVYQNTNITALLENAGVYPFSQTFQIAHTVQIEGRNLTAYTVTKESFPIHEFIESLCNSLEEKYIQDKILTLSHFKAPNERQAAAYIAQAQESIEQYQFAEALGKYGEALQYTRSSDVYAAIPQLYDQLGETNKATLSRLRLGQYQLQEGKVQEAISTLESIETDIVDVSAVVNVIIALLYLLQSHSAETAAQATKRDEKPQINSINNPTTQNPTKKRKRAKSDLPQSTAAQKRSKKGSKEPTAASRAVANAEKCGEQARITADLREANSISG